MKRLGVSLSAKLQEVVVIPRDSEDFVFKVRPVIESDYEVFNKLCPQPEPEMVTRAGNAKPVANLEDADYLAALDFWATLKTSFMFLKALTATEWIEWETVEVGDKSTWGNVNVELLKAGFADHEVVMLFNAAMSVNGMNPQKYEVAKANFLAGQG